MGCLWSRSTSNQRTVRYILRFRLERLSFRSVPLLTDNVRLSAIRYLQLGPGTWIDRPDPASVCRTTHLVRRHLPAEKGGCLCR
jgi:hypothetical protein